MSHKTRVEKTFEFFSNIIVSLIRYTIGYAERFARNGATQILWLSGKRTQGYMSICTWYTRITGNIPEQWEKILLGILFGIGFVFLAIGCFLWVIVKSI